MDKQTGRSRKCEKRILSAIHSSQMKNCVILQPSVVTKERDPHQEDGGDVRGIVFCKFCILFLAVLRICSSFYLH